jgi:hypothetical protein
MGSSSAGGSGLGFGFSIGSTWRDGECVRRLNARELAATLGDREAAREVMCANEDIFRVYNALGRPCRLTPKGEPNPLWTQASQQVAPPPPAASPPPRESQAAPPPALSPPPAMANEATMPPPSQQPKPSQVGDAARQLPEYSLSFHDGATGLDSSNTRVLEQAVAAYPRWGTVRVMILDQAEPRILQLRMDNVHAYLTSHGIPGVAQIVVASGGVVPIEDRKEQPAQLNGNAPVATSEQKPAQTSNDAREAASNPSGTRSDAAGPVAIGDSSKEQLAANNRIWRNWRR